MLTHVLLVFMEKLFPICDTLTQHFLFSAGGVPSFYTCLLVMQRFGRTSFQFKVRGALDSHSRQVRTSETTLFKYPKHCWRIMGTSLSLKGKKPNADRRRILGRQVQIEEEAPHKQLFQICCGDSVFSCNTHVSRKVAPGIRPTHFLVKIQAGTASKSSILSW